MMSGTTKTFFVRYIAVFAFVFSPFWASASVLFIQPSETPAASCTLQAGSSGAGTATSSMMIFSPTYSGTLGAVTLDIHAIGSNYPTSKINVYESDSNGNVTGWQTSSSTLLSVTPSLVTWRFNNTKTLTAGNYYTVSFPDGDSGAYNAAIYGRSSTSSDFRMRLYDGFVYAVYSPTSFCSVGQPFMIIESGTTTTTVIDPTMPSTAGIIPECAITDIGECVSRAIAWAFVPPPETWDQFITLKDDLKNKAPFGYFTSAAAALSGISGTSTPAFSLATSSPLMTHIFSPLRTGLLWLLYFAAALWIYKRLTHIQA